MGTQARRPPPAVGPTEAPPGPRAGDREAADRARGCRAVELRGRGRATPSARRDRLRSHRRCCTPASRCARRRRVREVRVRVRQFDDVGEFQRELELLDADRTPVRRLQDTARSDMATQETHAATAAPTSDTPLRPTHPDIRVGVVRRNSESGVDQFDTVEWEVRDAIIPGKDGRASSSARSTSRRPGRRRPRTSWRRSTSAGSSARPSASGPVRQMIGGSPTRSPPGAARTTTSPMPKRPTRSTPSSSTCCCTRRPPSTRRSGSTSGSRSVRRRARCFILVDRRLDGRDPRVDLRGGSYLRGGSGSGINLSRLRSSPSSSPRAADVSGPVSFMRGADASAGTIKSGGKTRRAAKMVVLDVDHPDIEEFIWCKSNEEEKARALQAAGYDISLDSSTGRRSSTRTRTTRFA